MSARDKSGPPALTGPTASADTLVRAGAVGALVGATGALATAARDLRSDTISRDAALRAVLGTAAKTGLATGLGAYVARSLRGGPLLSATAMVLTGAATLYALEGATAKTATSQPEPPTKATTPSRRKTP